MDEIEVDGLVDVRDGFVEVPDEPGFGIRLDWSAISRAAGEGVTRVRRREQA